jgi:hypothetical protein
LNSPNLQAYQKSIDNTLQIFARTKFDNCGSATVASWKTYCDANDTFCDHGESIDAHLHYVKDYFDDIVGFIKAQVAKKSSHSSMFGLDKKKYDL